MVDIVPTEPTPDAARGHRGRWAWFGAYLTIALGLAALNLYFWSAHLSRPLPAGAECEAPAERSFDGASESLRQSVFLATLERPIPDGKSALWCATLPMAWQELETAFTKPVRVVGAEEICRELSDTPKAELNPAHYFAAGGKVRDGIHQHIKDNLERRFPNAKLPSRLDSSDRGLVGYACLEVSLLYDYLFKHDERPLKFREGNGRETLVHAFGLREADKGQGGGSREQVLLLFRDKGEFAVDLSHNTRPYQIILARMNRKPSLKDTLADLDKRCADSGPLHLSSQSILLVPTMNWRIEHSFRELIGPIDDPPWEVRDASQSIQFKMDRKGAYIISEAMVTLPDNGHPEDEHPEYFLFDRPYLLVMKKRGTQQPFFVMWVDNAELLQRH